MYMIPAVAICLRLLSQLADCALRLAEAKAGSNRAARIAMMAMTTNNSMRAKPRATRARDLDLSVQLCPTVFILYFPVREFLLGRRAPLIPGDPHDSRHRTRPNGIWKPILVSSLRHLQDVKLPRVSPHRIGNSEVATAIKVSVGQDGPITQSDRDIR